MIVTEQNNSFILISQHEHALISGQMMTDWRTDLFPFPSRRDSCLLAIAQHDRGWLAIDRTAFWNDAEGAPYSFIDFPREAKTVFYRHGVDEVERRDRYAALLCSLHYQSFFDEPQSEMSADVLAFVRYEDEREQRLIKELRLSAADDDMVKTHVDLLQLADNMSLYLCLNEPGVAKEQEWPWYKDGFRQQLAVLDNKKIIPNWVERDRVTLHPFPFENEVLVHIPYKKVYRSQINSQGLAAAYAQSAWQKRTVMFTSPN